MALLGRRRQVARARSLLRQLPPDDPTGTALAELIDVPPGERYWMMLDAIDWVQRQTPGVPREACERKLLPTSHRLLVMRPGAIAAINYEECEPFGYRKLGMQGFVLAASQQGTWEFSTHWAAARALVELLNELRVTRRATAS